jgi:hypothetical protein
MRLPPGSRATSINIDRSAQDGKYPQHAYARGASGVQVGRHDTSCHLAPLSSSPPHATMEQVVKPLPQFAFDVYALALPRGHAFGDHPPVEAWSSESGRAVAAVTRSDRDGVFGVLVLRRREDQVWATVRDQRDLSTLAEARSLAETELRVDRPAMPPPPGTRRRPPLFDLKRRKPTGLFELLRTVSHHQAACMLNHLYLALPSPDPNWASDCQTENFHARMWEAILLGCLREQGLLVAQPERNPDFRIENRKGEVAWIEAVTANPEKRYEHVNAWPTVQPSDPEELFRGAAALRFAKSLGNKLDRRYDQLSHVAGKPFALAIADFHAPGSMVWSREALIGYLYGLIATTTTVAGRRVALAREVHELLDESRFPAGLFRNANREELSAVIFTNACTVAKLNRVPVSAGAAVPGLRYVRCGRFFDRTPGALEGIPFCLDVAGEGYRRLWPQRYEPWSAELEVFHNPFARYPLPQALLPEATHWFDAERNGDLHCSAYYATSILWSLTLIQNSDDPMPTYEFLAPPRARGTRGRSAGRRLSRSRSAG